MSDCSCIYINVDEYSDVSHSTIRKARKQHKCDECEKTIEPQTQYEETTSLYDGCWSRHRTCLDYASVAKHLICSRYYLGNMWSDVRERIDYCSGNIDLNAVAKLTPKARKTVCTIIEEVWEGLEDD